MKKLRQNESFRKLIWSIVVLILTFSIQYLSNLPREFSPLLVLIVREITKYINVELLGDLWVEKLEKK